MYAVLLFAIFASTAYIAYVKKHLPKIPIDIIADIHTNYQKMIAYHDDTTVADSSNDDELTQTILEHIRLIDTVSLTDTVPHVDDASFTET